jgi:hypothetical protein
MGDIGVNGRLLGCVWECQPGVLSKPWNMLAMDAFHGHLSIRIRNRLGNKNTDLVVIPSGMISKLQPLKHLVHKHYDDWLNKDNHIFDT